jgi:hypothetical protein
MPAATRFALLLLLFAVFVNSASAFGAGSLPDDSNFKEFVWRHGDISEVLRYLPSSFLTGVSFTKLQRRQIYFGNWLRDFSQVVDTVCLENIPEPVLRAIVCVMGMLEFGFATDEFDVTRERLGCYTHVEHIDNPRGYDSNAKEIDTRLRGPVDPEELEFDPKTGMKNYIANSGKGWDTAADYIRRQLLECIELGRKGKAGDPGAAKESFIHLGAALHTLEDFAAHSNFIELCLHDMGEESVFLFVGDECRVSVPNSNRKVAPIVTGTFGMLDIFHSLLGEADDMAILQSKGSLDHIQNTLGYGAAAFDQLCDAFKAAIAALPDFSSKDDGDDSITEQLEVVKKIFNEMTPDDSSDEEGSKEESSDDDAKPVDPALLWQALEPVLAFHDRVKKWLLEGSDNDDQDSPKNDTSKVGELTDEFVFHVVNVVIKSSVKELRATLRAAKARVDEEASSADTAAVFESGSSASDPSHSDLSKDHFSNMLNRPAGLVATVTSNWTTQQIVKCWDDSSVNAEDVISDVLTILHHPAFVENKSEIQGYMQAVVGKWWNELPDDEKTLLRDKLTKEMVKDREHEDHHMVIKPKGRHGPGEFPGSKVAVAKAKPRESFSLNSALRKFASDSLRAIQTVLSYLLAPAKFVGRMARNAKDSAAGLFRRKRRQPA